MEKLKLEPEDFIPNDMLCKITINDKEAFKKEIISKIEKYKKDFPVYFFGNLFINVSLILLMVAIFIVIAMFFPIMKFGENGAEFYGELFAVGIISFIIISSILKITTKGLLKNIKIIRKIREGRYDFKIENYEMDNLVEFIEDLPMKKEDVARLKTSLSFEELIEVSEAVSIISHKKGYYVVDISFRNEMRDILTEEFIDEV